MLLGWKWDSRMPMGDPDPFTPPNKPCLSAPQNPKLTHPDFAKLPSAQLSDQLDSLPGDLPLILGPGVLRG